MNTFLSSYIHPDQVGFVPNHQAPDKTRRLIDVISAVQSNWDNHGPRRSMLSLDLCKAFDSVMGLPILCTERLWVWPKIFGVLWTLYSIPSARTQVKGYTSPQIDIHRGTRQGCPLSPILFLWALEPLAIKIRSHPDIKGIHCGEHKCAMFADDILILLLSPVMSLPNLYRTLRHFSMISGLSINHSKLVALNLSLEANTVAQLQT